MKTSISTVGEEYGGKISTWKSHMGNILRGSIELLAENVKHSDEVEGLQYLRSLFCAWEYADKSRKKDSWYLKELMEHTDFSALWIEVPTHLNAYASIHIFITYLHA